LYTLPSSQEYCDGGTLKDALDGSRFSDPSTGLANLETAVRVAIEIAAGMTYIHARNIIHGGENLGGGVTC
jgi:serine/threonine protein kinase